jgi:hypothetical protein
MFSPDLRFVHTLVLEEIRRVVAHAILTGVFVRAGRCAAKISQAYPNSGMTADELADEIVEAAIRARVNVEISKPKHDFHMQTSAYSAG